MELTSKAMREKIFKSSRANEFELQKQKEKDLEDKLNEAIKELHYGMAKRYATELRMVRDRILQIEKDVDNLIII